MTLTEWMLVASGWVYAAVVLVCLAVAVIRKRDPASALGWSLAIVFLPVAGPLLFAMFGCNRVSRRLRRKILHRESFAEQRSVHTTLAGHGREQPGQQGPLDRWDALSAVLERLDQPPCRSGNRTELYTRGRRAFLEMERAIRCAEHHVHVEFYIFRPDEAGERFVEALCDRARAGVRVRMVLDGLGSFGAQRMKSRLRRAGVEVTAFRNPLNIVKLATPNLRNHRKLVICDGQRAFFGGLNIGSEYLGGRRNRGRTWADLHCRIDGPAVWDLQWIFVEDWHYTTGELIDAAEYFPAMPASGPADPTDGEQSAQVIGGGPDQQPSPIRQAFLGAITRARESIEIASPYLVPDSAICDVLALAARSGIRVRIVTQHPPPDSWLTQLCAMTFFEEFESAGIEVYGYQPGMMHAKAIAIDGEWAMVGTANLDNRSMFLNFELMVAFDDGGEPSRVRGAIEDLIGQSVRLDRQWVQRQPGWQRSLAHIVRLLAPLL